MNIDNKLGELKKIRQVDAPPFLFSRIQQAILNTGKAEAPVKWKWAFAATAVMVLILNLSIVFNSNNKEDKAGINTVVNAMNLSSTNALYHE